MKDQRNPFQRKLRLALLTFVTAAVLWSPQQISHSQILDEPPAVEPASTSQTFTVTTATGSGAGSLRQAITDANANPGLDTIVFNIPGSGVQTQFATTTFPTITDPVIIDGTTQPGYAGVPLVQLDDAGGSNRAFNVTSGGTTIKGIDFIGFGGGTANAIIALSSSGNTVAGCTFGIGGTTRSANAILVDGTSNNVIGGTTAASRNYFPQNNNVLIQNGGTNNRVTGNWFGVDTNGQPVSARSNYAVRVDSSPGNFIGGPTGTTPGGACTGECNVIVKTDAIVIAGSAATGNKVAGNFIGLLADGLTVSSNSANGVYINGAPNNLVGGTTASERNVIVGNAQSGVLVEGAASTGNVITGNYIGVKTDGAGTSSNSGFGILIRSSAGSTRIGGLTAGERNVISGNNTGAISLITGNHTVEGNYIGTDATGMNRSTTRGPGITISSNNNIIGDPTGTTRGGACTGGCNVISGNGVDGQSSGIFIIGASGNAVDANYIGLNAAGTAAILNGITPDGTTFQGDAITLVNASDNIIGRQPQNLPRPADNFWSTQLPASPDVPTECIQDAKTGDFISFDIGTGQFTARQCASGRTLTGTGTYRNDSPGAGEPDFTSERDAPGLVHADYNRGGTYGTGLIVFPEGLPSIKVDGIRFENVPCTCPTKGIQDFLGSVNLTGQGGDSNGNYIGSQTSGLNTVQAPLLPPNEVFTKPPIVIAQGNNNTVENAVIASPNTDGIEIDNGVNNAIATLHERLGVGKKPILLKNNANDGLSKPVFNAVRREVGRTVRLKGTFGNPLLPNAHVRLRLYGVSMIVQNDIETDAVIDLGIVIDLTTGPEGNVNFDVVYSGVDADKIMYQEDIAATATVVTGSPTPSTALATPTTEVLGDTSEMSLAIKVPRPPADFDYDGKTDIAVYRSGATATALSFWYIFNSADSTVNVVQFGIGEDIPVPGDYNGLQTTDLAVWRPSSGTWYWSKPTGTPAQNFYAFRWGVQGDVPVAGDFDGDGRNDLGIYRNGTWWIMQSLSGTPLIQQFGVATDTPVPADYNGDGRTDIAVYRNGVWYESVCPTCAVQYGYFGVAGDKPVPADYDGDGKADLAVYRGGNWFILGSTAGFSATKFGVAGDIPAPGDFDADGKADIGLFRFTEGNWYAIKSSDGSVLYGFHFGQQGDIPVAGANFK